VNTKQILTKAKEAFLYYHKTSEEIKGTLLETIAQEIEKLGDELLNIASDESNLTLARLQGERGRTCGQLRLFAKLVKSHTYQEISIDTAQPDRQPLPKADIRKYNIGLGPVMIFGASNFPLAFSTAGGDTASALAAGCSVIYKSHPGHPKTSKMVADAIARSLEILNLPSSTFQHIETQNFDEVKTLVEEDDLTGVAFTGSYHGGMAIVDYAKKRLKPIPIFTEMGSVNPTIILDFKDENESNRYSTMLASSITMGIGQFCTKPGLIFGIKGESCKFFIDKLVDNISQYSGGNMLTLAIKANYVKRLQETLAKNGVNLLTSSFQVDDKVLAIPALGLVSAKSFLADKDLADEVFGPFALFVVAEDMKELIACIDKLEGQLTCTFLGEEKSIGSQFDLINLAKVKAGRILINNVPTGVEVCDSMVHGGPFPATSDMRFTSVGSDAIKRWYRPVCFQNFPDELLPLELQRTNPLSINRKVNGLTTKENA
jgi:2,5-dioxopentanoate dehydrogenase